MFHGQIQNIKAASGTSKEDNFCIKFFSNLSLKVLRQNEFLFLFHERGQGPKTGRAFCLDQDLYK